jgi:hypothetical protein
MELFGKNSKVYMSLIVKGDAIQAYLGYNIVTIQH